MCDGNFNLIFSFSMPPHMRQSAHIADVRLQGLGENDDYKRMNSTV